MAGFISLRISMKLNKTVKVCSGCVVAVNYTEIVVVVRKLSSMEQIIIGIAVSNGV